MFWQPKQQRNYGPFVMAYVLYQFLGLLQRAPKILNKEMILLALLKQLACVGSGGILVLFNFYGLTIDDSTLSNCFLKHGCPLECHHLMAVLSIVTKLQNDDQLNHLSFIISKSRYYLHT